MSAEISLASGPQAGRALCGMSISMTIPMSIMGTGTGSRSGAWTA